MFFDFENDTNGMVNIWIQSQSRLEVVDFESNQNRVLDIIEELRVLGPVSLSSPL